MKRRAFLETSLWSGYSLLVLAGQGGSWAAADDGPRDVEDIHRGFDRIAPRERGGAPPDEPHMARVGLECDVLVAGGGMSGVCAAVAAARHGARVVLVQDRSRLGGNASSEVKMHIVGANHHKSRPGWREGGLLEEFRLDDAVNNPQRCWELWDLLLYDKVMSEPNITLLLDTVLFRAEVADGRITRVHARCDKTEILYDITAAIFCDCTGDSRLALEAGAEMRHGRESRDEYGEPLAPFTPDRETLGSSILFTARQHDRPMPFTPPHWARKVKSDQLVHRKITSWEYGYWWIEWGGHFDTIRDNERIRFELLSIVMGVWDYIKNSGDHPTSANWALDWVGMMPGKRESRRILGEHVLTQADLMGLRHFDDAVAIGGWPMDDHPPAGFDRPQEPAFIQVKTPVYNLPLRCLYSRTVQNLMMAGRNLSASHVAFTSTRVMGTCSVAGQAAGTAAALCARHQITPAELYRDKPRLRALQQALLRDDQSILELVNNDPDDRARHARATASAEAPGCPATRILDGQVRDIPGGETHRWSAPLAPENPPWIALEWDQPQTLRQIQVTFDTGFSRELTLTSSDWANKTIIRAPQPETVRDYRLSIRKAPDGPWEELLAVQGNHQRLARHEFAPVSASALRLEVLATNGDPLARVFEIRAYG